MADQEDNVEKSGEFKSLGGFGKTISSVGWGITVLGVAVSVLGALTKLGKLDEMLVVIGIIMVPFGFIVVISGQAISCMVAIARHTETTNNILIKNQTELLEALKEKS